MRFLQSLAKQTHHDTAMVDGHTDRLPCTHKKKRLTQGRIIEPVSFRCSNHVFAADLLVLRVLLDVGEEVRHPGHEKSLGTRPFQS